MGVEENEYRGFSRSQFYSKRELRETRNWTDGMLILNLLPICSYADFSYEGVFWLYRKELVKEVELMPDFRRMMDERLATQLSAQFCNPAVMLKRFASDSYAREKLTEYLTPGELDRLMNYSFRVGEMIKPKTIRRQ